MAVKEKEPELFTTGEDTAHAAGLFRIPSDGKQIIGVYQRFHHTAGESHHFPVGYGADPKLGYPEDIFLPLQMPGTKVGQLLPEIQKEVGFNLEVVLCGSHDTASAVMAVPQTEGDGIYISSGTWSLMGIESLKPGH